jgi:hypothetical protein
VTVRRQTAPGVLFGATTLPQLRSLAAFGVGFSPNRSYAEAITRTPRRSLAVLKHRNCIASDYQRVSQRNAYTARDSGPAPWLK